MIRPWHLAGALVCAGLIGAGCSSNSPHSSSTSTPQRTSTSASATVPTTLAPTTTTSSTVAAAQSCNTVTATAGQTDGAAGTITGSIILANGGSTTCTMMGYPVMAMFSSGATALPITMADGLTVDISPAANGAPTVVTLAPGAKGAFTYQYSDVISGNETSCPSSATVSATSPGATSSSAPIALVMDPCDNGTIRVSPMYPSS